MTTYTNDWSARTKQELPAYNGPSTPRLQHRINDAESALRQKRLATVASLITTFG
jgi:hypothetical protein